MSDAFWGSLPALVGAIVAGALSIRAALAAEHARRAAVDAKLRADEALWTAEADRRLADDLREAGRKHAQGGKEQP